MNCRGIVAAYSRVELPVVFCDEHLVAVHKPSGLLVHRSPVDRRERRFAVQELRQQLGRHVYPVHRLDKGTSGLLLFALDRETGRRLSLQFAERSVHKTYVAVVRGHPPEAGEIDHPLRAIADEYGGASSTREQQAITAFRRLATAELPCRVDRYPTSRYALLELQPLTGRRHQLRRHLKHVSHPIIGDATYGKGRHNRLFQTLFASDRLLLACTELRLNHPVSGQPLLLRCPLAADFLSVTAALGWQLPSNPSTATTC